MSIKAKVNGEWVVVGGVSGDFIIPPDTAEVGQTIRVSAVDENGKPTAWEAVDMASGGSGANFEKIASLTVEQFVNSVTFDTDINGEPFSLKRMIVLMKLPAYDDGTNTGTGYTTYKINKINQSYLYNSNGWDNSTFLLDFVALGDAYMCHGYKKGDLESGQPWERWHDVLRKGQYETITAFTWGLFGRGVIVGSAFEVYGVRA